VNLKELRVACAQPVFFLYGVPMSLSEDILSNLTGFSKAMYSTWFYYRPGRVLFDSGEGVSTTMDNFSFGIESIFLSHGHYDHIGGLPGLIHARNSGRGDKEKSLQVFYPSGDSLIGALREYTNRVCFRLSYKLDWHEVEPGQEIPMRVGGKGACCRTFRTRHTRTALTLGYSIIERRTKLKDEFAREPQERIRDLVVEHGRDHVMQSYDHILLAYGGDSLSLNAEDIEGAEVVVHDATFLNDKDRDEPTHATSEEAIRLAKDANVQCLVLHHVSSRYSSERILNTVASQVQSIAPDLKVMIALGRSIQPARKKSMRKKVAHG
jgi:ribonuclease Z